MRKNNFLPDLSTAAIPRQWLAETEKLVLALQPVQDQEKVSARHRDRLARIRAAVEVQWEPRKRLSELALYSQRKCWAMRWLLCVYYQAVDDGLSPSQAETVTRLLSLSIFQKAISSRTVRLKIARIEAAGGPNRVRIEIFCGQ